MRLQVTRKADLALRALRALGERGGERVKGPALAAAVGSTTGFVSHVLTPLSQRGWVQSDPGPSGGYSTTVDLAGLSVLEVIEAIEGPTDSGQCMLDDGSCRAEDPCTLHDAWTAARANLEQTLAAVSVANAPISEPRS